MAVLTCRSDAQQDRAAGARRLSSFLASNVLRSICHLGAGALRRRFVPGDSPLSGHCGLSWSVIQAGFEFFLVRASGAQLQGSPAVAPFAKASELCKLFKLCM